MRYVVVAIIGLTMAMSAGAANAKGKAGRYCLTGVDNKSKESCFATLKQCKASKTGNGDTCERK